MTTIHQYLGPLIAVIVAAVIAYVYTSYLSYLASKNEIIKEYFRDLDEIEAMVGEYWLGPHELPEHNVRLTTVGHQLRAKLSSTDLYSDVTKSILGEKIYSKYEKLDVELFMAATGGNFQTKAMAPCPATYGIVVSKIHELKSALQEARTGMFWKR